MANWRFVQMLHADPATLRACQGEGQGQAPLYLQLPFQLGKEGRKGGEVYGGAVLRWLLSAFDADLWRT